MRRDKEINTILEDVRNDSNQEYSHEGDGMLEDMETLKAWANEALQETVRIVDMGRYASSGKETVKGRHPSLAHTSPVIYYPNHPVYDLDLPQGSLNRVGDNVYPNTGEAVND